MEESLYQVLCYIMPILAIVVFIALFYIQAGYGIFQNKQLGNKHTQSMGMGTNGMPGFFLHAILMD